MESLGYFREAELYEALVKRFGRNCVYRSPRIRVHGQEKELGDVVVLALPYMIVFQSKWKQISSEELCGEKGEVYRNRLLKTMKNAAGQFKELASSLRQKAVVELPQVWVPNSGETYQFPLELVEHVLPVVVIDFDDRNYDDPNERYEDVPPVVSEVPSQIKSWGAVHSFLLRDFYRIIEQLFTVGDLLSWLQERERMVANGGRAIIGYGELTMFAIYLANYSLWETMYRSDCVLMTDNDCFERITKDWKSDFEKRQRVFGQRCFLDVVDDLMVYSLKETDVEARNDAILSYLTCQGRLLCCSAQSKRTMSLKLIEHLRNFTKDGKSFRGSFAISEEPIPPIGTALYLGVAPYDSEKDALEYVTRAYCRTLAVLRDQGLENVIKEVLVLFVHYQTPQVVCMLKKIELKDYDLAPDEEIVSSDKYMEAKQRMNLSEWDVARQMP